MYAQRSTHKKVPMVHCVVTDLRVPSNVVHVLSHEVSEAMGHEHSTQSNLHHLLHLTTKKTSFLQLFKLNTLC